MKEIFPPTFYTYGEDVINEMNKSSINNEVEDLLQRFAPKAGQKHHSSQKKESNVSALRKEELRI